MLGVNVAGLFQLTSNLLANTGGKEAVVALELLRVRHLARICRSLNGDVRHFNKEGRTFSNELEVDSARTRILGQVI